jgi:hypothetical protein
MAAPAASRGAVRAGHARVAILAVCSICNPSGHAALTWPTPSRFVGYRRLAFRQLLLIW